MEPQKSTINLSDSPFKMFFQIFLGGLMLGDAHGNLEQTAFFEASAVGKAHHSHVSFCSRPGRMLNPRIEEKLEKLKNEAVIYLQLEHPNIARLFDVYEDHHEVGEVWMGVLGFRHQVSESMVIGCHW